MTDLPALIARLEVAKEGSRELDRDIALAVGWYPTGIEEIGCFFDPATGGLRGEIHEAPHYTTSLDAALPWENICGVVRMGDGTWAAKHVTKDRVVKVARAATEVLARRAAALKEKL